MVALSCGRDCGFSLSKPQYTIFGFRFLFSKEENNGKRDLQINTMQCMGTKKTKQSFHFSYSSEPGGGGGDDDDDDDDRNSFLCTNYT